ncbi:UNVERIFIED_CONTAM: PTS cellbiose transporter, partial [Bifidobacterium breve]
SKVYRKNYVDGKKDIIALNDVVAEIEAQYKIFFELVCIKPDYFEGHAVTSDNFEKGLRIVLY